MKVIILKILIFAIAICFFMVCSPSKPTGLDGTLNASFIVYDTSGVLVSPDSAHFVPVANAVVTFSSDDYKTKYQFKTDDHGRVDVKGLIVSSYNVDFRLTLPTKTTLIGDRQIDRDFTQTEPEMVILEPKSPTPITINEIYYAGPVNNQFFFYDQFIELFNPTDTTNYLDGMILTRVRTSADTRPYIEIWDYVQNTYAFKFPGEPGEKNHPIEPGQFIVVASDAYNHTLTNPNAVNLENADYEFYNQNGPDYDNPNVPNLINLIPTHRTEFLISLGSDAIVLGDGKNWSLVTETTSTSTKDYVNIPIENIVDGVEYQPGTSSNKEMTIRVDAGKAGAGLPKYSGKSIERINYFQDSDNSTFDFQINETPTPGYFHQ